MFPLGAGYLSLQVPTSPVFTVVIFRPSPPPPPPPQPPVSFSLEQRTCSADLNSPSRSNVLQINIPRNEEVPVAGAKEVPWG